MSSYVRYLASKKTVDDRALNRHVVDTLRGELARAQGPLRILEIGAGLGTMVARLIDWGLVRHAEYTLLDVDSQSLSDSREWLGTWARSASLSVQEQGDGLRIHGRSGEVDVLVRTACVEIAHYLESGPGAAQVDLLIANAFLDVVDVPTILPAVFRLVAPGGLYWFSINFDGETIFGPDHPADAPLMAAYHRGMDERVRYGRPAGESRCGRHLYAQLRAAGATVLASGSSDWVVHAGPEGRYLADEQHFVSCILGTIEEGLRARTDVDATQLTDWLATRRAQLDKAELLYIAHQIDYCGRVG